MKQKFTLNIADIQLSVIADASREDVERIRGLLDRKMREIYLKSRCPKTEAALLCAMDFAADRLTMQEQIAELDERCEKYSLVLDSLKQRTSDQAAELERLRSENAVLRSLLTRDTAPAIAPDPISPTAFFAEVAEAQMTSAQPSVPAEEPVPVEEPSPAKEADPVEETEPAEETAPVEEADPQQVDIFDIQLPVEETAPEVQEPAPQEAPRPRSRVGAMFQQLSFGDID